MNACVHRNEEHMGPSSWSFATNAEARPPRRPDPIGAVRPRGASEADERADHRRARLAEQRADSNPPAVRIRAWETLHGLRMPASPSHPVLDLIAIETRLTLAEVQAEQRVRRQGAPDPKHAP
jgi:hypothetical protein